MRIWLVRLITAGLTFVILGFIFFVQPESYEATDVFILKIFLFIVLVSAWAFWIAEEGDKR